MLAVNIYDQYLVTLHSYRMFLVDHQLPTFVVKDNSTSLICTQAYMQGAPPTSSRANACNVACHLLSSEATPSEQFCITPIHCNVLKITL